MAGDAAGCNQIGLSHLEALIGDRARFEMLIGSAVRASPLSPQPTRLLSRS